MATVMQAVHGFQERTFSSLRIRNYRLYVLGQGISLSGTWMQTIAQGLLVLRLTGSGTALGLVVALQTLPILFLGPWGGVIADRFPKRSILYVTQTVSAVLALSLGTLVATDLIELWMLYGLAICLGLVNMVDNPTRQTFVLELVGKDELPNAVSLNSTQINLARVIGPSIAGGLVATVGLAACFIVNGLSFLAVLLVLRRMRADELRPTPVVARAKGQLAEGFRYVRGSPIVLNTLLMMAIIGTFTYEFQVILPLFSEFTFHDGESGYAAMTAAMGVGAVIGGLATAGRRRGGAPALVRTAAFFGLSVLLTALAPNLFLAILGLIVVGYCSISFTSLGNVTIQLASAPEMRGRVMALWTVAFLGSTPIGGPIIGAIGEHAGPRWGLVVGGIAALVAAGLGTVTLLHGQGGSKETTAPAPAGQSVATESDRASRR